MTSNIQFSGMEAFSCVFITQNITEEAGARSGLLRATTRLLVISYAEVVDYEEVKRHFSVADTTGVQHKQEKGAERKKRYLQPMAFVFLIMIVTVITVIVSVIWAGFQALAKYRRDLNRT